MFEIFVLQSYNENEHKCAITYYYISHKRVYTHIILDYKDILNTNINRVECF